MSDIKFSCPHCTQHIACDGDYAGLSIACPGCGKSMVIPRLIPTAESQAILRMMATVPKPERRPATPPPLPPPRRQDQWTEHVPAKGRNQPGEFPLWIVSALVTLILATALRAGGTSWVVITVVVVAGAGISLWLMLGRGAELEEGADVAFALGKALLILLLVIVGIPAIALGVLFVGCATCR